MELHGLRGSLNVALATAGTPDTVRADWLGHRVEVNPDAYLARTGASMAAARAAITETREAL